MNVIMKIMLNVNIKFMKNKMKVLIIKVKIINISYSNNYKNERKKYKRIF